MRMIVVAGLLTMALLGAVLSSVGADRLYWVSAPDDNISAPEREISNHILPGSRVFWNRG